jgi:hypothetical protein
LRTLQALVSLGEKGSEEAGSNEGVLYVLRDLDEAAVACLSFLEDVCGSGGGASSSGPTLSTTAFRFLSLWLSENPGIFSKL